MFKRKKPEPIAPTQPIIQAPAPQKSDLTPMERRSAILSMCLQLTGISLETMASRVANQAWFQGLTRLERGGAAVIIAGVIGKQIEVSVFEWKCIVYVLSSPVLHAIREEAGRTGGDAKQLERRGIAVKACVELTRLSLDDVAARVAQAAWGHLNVRSLHGPAAKERLTMLINGTQDLSEAEWKCVKIGILDSADKFISQYLDSDNCVPVPPTEDTMEIRRRIRLLKGSMVIEGLSLEAAARKVGKLAAELGLGGLSQCDSAKIENLLEQRLFVNEYEWKCLASAILLPAFTTLEKEIQQARERSDGDNSRRLALIDGCMTLLDQAANDVAQGVQRLSSRADVASIRGKSLQEVQFIVEAVIKQRRAVDNNEWWCFVGLLADAAFVLKHERDTLDLDLQRQST
jgi:hypothetical protein